MAAGVAPVVAHAGSGRATLNVPSESEILSFDLSPITPQQTVLGQPIVLHYKITNRSNVQGIATQDDHYFRRWYQGVLVDENNRVVRTLPDPRPEHPAGAYSSPNPIFEPHAVREGEIVVNKLFAITRPGAYTLTINVNMPYTGVQNVLDVHGDRDAYIRSVGTVIQRTFTFHLTVKNTDPEYLRRLADSLRGKFLAEGDPARQRIYQDELFAMPDTAAEAAWRTLAFDATVPDRLALAKALAETQSLKAADILVKMEFEMPISVIGAPPFSLLRTLKDMSNQGSPEMKATIGRLLAKHHTSVLQVPGISD